ncbi:MBL fold metallo-hydrolase, partial [Thermosulfuriphilus sp.]
MLTRRELFILGVLSFLRLAIGSRVHGMVDPVGEELSLKEMARRRLHHQRGRFRNPWLPQEEIRLWTYLKWQLSRNPYREAKRHAKAPEVIRLRPYDLVSGANPEVFFLGHATVWGRVAGRRILFDPIFDDVRPFFRRLTPFPLQPEHLPQPDLVLISHGHRDHLALSSLKILSRGPLILVPLGGGRYLRKIADQVIEFDWFETRVISGLKVTLLPCQHWSKMGLFDTNAMLWGSWLVEAEGLKLFFAGDTGYFRGFKEYGERFGPIDLAFLPIGAFEPRWFMRFVHLDPFEAVRAAKDLRACLFVPIHWGVFDMSDEPVDLPPRLVKEAALKEGLLGRL